ncbi:hypothetical protein [Novosphingobium sp.]|uniref:hypothetical protein n=1 Tax=Novosphingobium sp. TaxID=1874826 RepID=UPI00260604B8|nr:hypothetical protein [Novosphingobium sp.]
MLRSLLRLGVYYVLLAVSLAIITSYRETFERVLVQTVFFALVSLFLVHLIRTKLPFLRHAWPEVLYLLATLFFALTSAIRLLDFVRTP